MITKQLNNLRPLITITGQAVKLDVVTIDPTAKQYEEYCVCECEYYEPVFAKTGGEWFENDQSAFLYKKSITNDTITINLYKNDELVEVLNTNKYGTYFANPKPLHVGYLIEWQKVYEDLGTGIYYIKAGKVILGQYIEEFSQKFELAEYSQERADDTVRIESYQNGNIISSPFNYTDMNWYQSIRIKGNFGTKKPKLEVDNYLDKDYNLLQIQDKIVNEWILETFLLPNYISNKLIYDIFLSDSLFISDFSIFAEEINYRVPVYMSEISDKKFFTCNKQTKFLLKFVDKLNNIIKNG
jgi:hypothetical protein